MRNNFYKCQCDDCCKTREASNRTQRIIFCGFLFWCLLSDWSRGKGEPCKDNCGNESREHDEKENNALGAITCFTGFAAIVALAIVEIVSHLRNWSVLLWS